MFRRIVIGSLCVLILLPSIFACSSTKDVEERKNYMIPKKSEMLRNSRYKEPGKRKTNHHKTKKGKHKSLF